MIYLKIFWKKSHMTDLAFHYFPTDLTCYTDYSQYITCVWNSAYEHTEARCKLRAVKDHPT